MKSAKSHLFLEQIASVLALDNNNGAVLLKHAYPFPTHNKTHSGMLLEKGCCHGNYKGTGPCTTPSGIAPSQEYSGFITRPDIVTARLECPLSCHSRL